MARTILRTGLVLLVACQVILFQGAIAAAEEKLYTKTFRTPAFHTGPGDVIDKYLDVEMPQGHVALRSFDTLVLDEDGSPVTLFETYLHHWVLLRFYVAKTTTATTMSDHGTDPHPKWQSENTKGEHETVILVPNSGVCGADQSLGSIGLVQWFGLGSETRRTNTTVPPPYGIVVGDPNDIPEEYDEQWVLNVHAIDTRGALNVRGCTECHCALYNVTLNEDRKPLPEGYEGGLRCCHDEMHCAVHPEFEGSKRTLYMEYTVTWIDMSDQVVPVRVYVLDVTDARKANNDNAVCQVEYTVDKCHEGSSKCIHKKEAYAFLPYGGDVIYAVAHQHAGGIGASLHNEDGEEICSSLPFYGNGTEAGNEDGYIVGMSTCFPEPGSVKVRAGEKLHHASLYDNEEQHLGVMGLFYLLVADPQSPPPKRDFHTSVILVGVTIVAALIFISVTVAHLRKRRGGHSYEAIPTKT